MSSCTNREHSQRSALKLVKYVPNVLDEAMSNPSSDAQVPIVLLPAMSENGYAIGIADPDGSPAWAKPAAAVETADCHRCHCHGGHRRRATRTSHGPEYLIPMGAPVPGQYPPGVILIPPVGPRMIPCAPIPGPNLVGRDIPGEYMRHHNHPFMHYGGNEAGELAQEFSQMRLQEEQAERFRFEEWEREQALSSARQQAPVDARAEYNRKRWARAMGVRQESDTDESESSASEEAARTININIRQPCKICKEFITVETQTVQHRFVSDGSNDGAGINIDGPNTINTDLMCDRCKAGIKEEAERADFLRRLVREVVDEKGSIDPRKVDKSKADDDEERAKLRASHSRDKAAAETKLDHKNQYKSYKHSLRSHGLGVGENHFEKHPRETFADGTTPERNDRRHHTRRSSRYRKVRPFIGHQTYIYSGSELDSNEENQVIVTPHKIRTRAALATLNKSRHTNVREQISSDSSSEGSESENMGIRYHDSEDSSDQSRRSYHKRSYNIPLAESIKENPGEFVESVLRQLNNGPHGKRGNGIQITLKPRVNTKGQAAEFIPVIDSANSTSSSGSFGGNKENESDSKENRPTKLSRHSTKKGSSRVHIPSIKGKGSYALVEVPASEANHGHTGRHVHRHHRSGPTSEHLGESTPRAKPAESVRHSSPQIKLAKGSCVKDEKRGGHVAAGGRASYLRSWSFLSKTSI
ncbi:hypothetical protein DRE_00933 [Drechslerella stenobrocha 248]|uniref:Stc1 domain-containing protein n=1 Tax=Drechslerella stenobrocha 248 TaxID=1043628 RepID=W7HNZ8_9PEZI|nr:hypothetical protein DRE_00933 [Drechslerella stenobrocha 248]